MQLVNLCSYRMVVLDPSLTKILVNKNEDLELLPWNQLFERFASVYISSVSFFFCSSQIKHQH